MAHDVFISYSRHDKALAEAVWASLETAGIQCWGAPRDPSPGGDWAAEIVQAIDSSKVFVLVFSGHCNGSVHVKNELLRAVNKEIPLIPFRVENERPMGALALHLEGIHWLDAFTPPFEGHLKRLSEVVERVIVARNGSMVGSKRSPENASPGAEPVFDIASPVSEPRPGNVRTKVEPDLKSLERQSLRYRLRSSPYAISIAGLVFVILLAVITCLVWPDVSQRLLQVVGGWDLVRVQNLLSKRDNVSQEKEQLSAQETAGEKERFAREQCGLIHDQQTGLDWFVGPDRNMTWYEAQDWIEKLSECGGGWRMPKVRELKTLFDPKTTAGRGHFADGKYWPAHIDPAFAAIGGGSWAWAGDAPVEEEARAFNFNQGGPASYSALDADYSTRAFAVRERR